MASTYRDLAIPLSTSTVSVKVFDTIPAGSHSKVLAPATGMLEPVLPGHESLAPPVFCFLVEHQSQTTTGKKRVVFDLGLRKDLENCAPPVAAFLGSMMPKLERDAVDMLEGYGVGKDSVEAVIWSHGHVDHTGDMSRFPASTRLVVSKHLVLESYDTNPSSTLLPSDFTGRPVDKIDFEFQLGGFEAHDYFGDGSLYLLDAPGHQAGHMCALARVTPTSFVLMGADTCHHVGVLRPTDAHHKHFPCPGDLLRKTRRSVSHQHFPNPDAGAGAGAGAVFDLEQHTTPLLRVGNASGPYHADHALAQRSADKLAVFDGNPDVFVVLAHDSSLLPFFDDAYPVVLDEWKAKGWKGHTVWSFLEEGNPAFRFDVRESPSVVM